MTMIETKPARPNMLSPLENDVDNKIGGVVAFILLNLPARRLLKRMAETGNHLTFDVGWQKWELEVADDKRGPNDESVLAITMTTLDPKTSQLHALDIFTDCGIENVIGVYFGDSKSHQALGIDPPVNFEEATKSLRREKYKSVIRSLRQTHSIRKTSRLQGLRTRLVRTRFNLWEDESPITPSGCLSMTPAEHKNKHLTFDKKGLAL